MKIEIRKLSFVGMLAGCAVLMQGCGTTMAPELPREPRPMPPPVLKPAPVKPVCPPTSPATGPVVEIPAKVTPPSGPAVTPKVVKPSAVETTIYTIRKGDTLSGIAHRYGLDLAELKSLNEISRPDRIFIGQKLILPGKIDINKPVKRRSSSHTMKSGKPIPPGSSVYVVQKGDCLSKIAARAGVKTSELRAANGLKSDVIYVGKKLVIPGGKKVKPVVATKNKTDAVAAPVTASEKPAPAVQPPTEGDFALPELEPEQPTTAPEAVAPDSTVQHYKVKDGDNILSVASEFNISIADLRKANNLESDVLTPGQVLVIPTQE